MASSGRIATLFASAENGRSIFFGEVSADLRRMAGSTIKSQTAPNQLIWIDLATGARNVVVGQPIDRDNSNGSWSPDGTRVAFRSSDCCQRHLWIADLASGTAKRIVTGDYSLSYVGGPAWSPDGTQLAFHCTAPSVYAACVVRADGTGFRVLSGALPTTAELVTWAPDGRRIAFAGFEGFAPTQGLFIIVNVATGEATRRSFASDFKQTAIHCLAWSADGSVIAYSRSETNSPFEAALTGIYLLWVDTSVSTLWAKYQATLGSSEGCPKRWVP